MGSGLMRLRYTAVAVSRSYTNSRPSLVTTYTSPYFSLICARESGGSGVQRGAGRAAKARDGPRLLQLLSAAGRQAKTVPSTSTSARAPALAPAPQRRHIPPAPHLQRHGEVVRELGWEEELGVALDGAAGRGAAQLDHVQLGDHGAVAQRLLSECDHLAAGVAAGELRGAGGAGAVRRR
jgi:hypothetical protein